MKRKIAIYLAGTIHKGHEKTDESYWTQEDLLFLRKELSEFEISFLNPALRSDNLSDAFSVFGRDMLQVFCSSIVFVDARERRGLGVGAEMMWAKINRIPVVAWAPKETHYHKNTASILGTSIENYMHPFVASLCDKVVEGLADGASWIRAAVSDPSIKIRGIEYIGSAMQHYKESQLHQDQPMKEMLTASDELTKRAQRAHPQVISN